MMARFPVASSKAEAQVSTELVKSQLYSLGFSGPCRSSTSDDVLIFITCAPAYDHPIKT